jgi:WD40 repeat protein
MPPDRVVMLGTQSSEQKNVLTVSGRDGLRIVRPDQSPRILEEMVLPTGITSGHQPHILKFIESGNELLLFESGGYHRWGTLDLNDLESRYLIGTVEGGEQLGLSRSQEQACPVPLDLTEPREPQPIHWGNVVLKSKDGGVIRSIWCSKVYFEKGKAYFVTDYPYDGEERQFWVRVLAVWAYPSGRLIGSIHLGGEDPSLRFLWQSDRLVAKGLQGEEVEVWDLIKVARIGTIKHEQKVHWIDMSSDASVLATGHADGVVRLWSIRDGLHFHSELRQEAGISRLTLDEDAERAVTAGNDRSIRVWDVASSQEQLRLYFDEGTPVLAATHSGAKLVAALSDRGELRLWKLPDGDIMAVAAEELKKRRLSERECRIIRVPCNTADR